MSDRKDGGPAFGGSFDTVFVSPDGLVEPQKIEYRSQGMSLRDYFAAKAMQAFITNDANAGSFDYYAAESYRFADSMLTERER